MAKKNTYDSSNITVLEGLDAVRLRPGMYIGSTGSRGLHHLLWEVLDNAIDEALAGHCDYITVSLENDNSVTITDNGRGIPVDTHKTGKGTLEVIMTILHAGGKFDNQNYEFSGGLHGVGLSVVNALSEKTTVTVKRDGKTYQQFFSKGNVKSKLTELGKTKEKGTSINFLPDKTIFSETVYNANTVKTRLKELSYLNAGITIVFKDNRKKSIDSETFSFKNGLIDYAKEVINGKQLKDVSIYSVGTEEPIEINKIKGTVDLIVTYTSDSYPNEISFVNNIRTVDGGTHINGFRTGLTKAINEVARDLGILKAKDSNFTSNDVREGIVAIVSIKLNNPQFESQTKDKLGTVEAATMVQEVTYSGMKHYLLKDKKSATVIIERIKLLVSAKIEAKKARDLVINKTNVFDNVLSGRLSNCSSKNPKEKELYIVEGESAGGSAKQGRDRRTQAILPLRGKVLNVEKGKDKMSENKEIKLMINAFGCGIYDNFNIDNLKYHKIIIMTDVDPDGKHIASLLLTFILNTMPELIKKGHVFIAAPPLFKITAGKNKYYCADDAEKEKTTKKLDKENKPYHVQRYKGLGEMNPDELKHTAMDPKQRILHQVTMKSLKKTKGVVNMLMGSTSIDERRAFIKKNAIKLNFNREEL